MDVQVSIEGTAPLIMHNGRLANPLDPVAKAMKAISGKRKKTDEDYEELARLEFLGGLYSDNEIGPYLPGDNIASLFIIAGRKLKLGKQVEEGLLITSDKNKLEYRGPRTPEKLWANKDFRFARLVRIQNARLMRTRPVFVEWSCQACGELDTAVLNVDALQTISAAAEHIGLGDWRPRYGRCTISIGVPEDV